MKIEHQEVKKLSLKNERLEATLEVDFKGQDPQGNKIETTDEVNRKSSQVIHSDLTAALKRLRIHMVCVCEQPEAVDINEENVYDFDPDELENYEVTGYSISGYDENQGVVLTGKKLLKSGNVLNINTPFIKYEDEEGYLHAASLMADVEACNYEVEAHLNGKWGIVQQEIPGFSGTEGESAPMEIVKEEEEAA